MNEQYLKLTQHNVDALYSASALLKSRGYWTADREIEQDTAFMIHELLHLLAWSDRSLHDNECSLIDAVLEVDKTHGSHIAKLIEMQQEGLELEPRIPGCIAAAALHDSVHQTRVVDVIMNHLENLALLVLMADGAMKHPETEALDSYFLRLRRSYSV